MARGGRGDITGNVIQCPSTQAKASPVTSPGHQGPVPLSVPAHVPTHGQGAYGAPTGAVGGGAGGTRRRAEAPSAFNVYRGYGFIGVFKVAVTRVGYTERGRGMTVSA